MKKRILSVLLCLVMVLGLLPTAAFAAESGEAPGKGTEADPYRVSTFAQLRDYLCMSQRELYIRIVGMDGTTGENGQITRHLIYGEDFSSYGAALIVLGKKHLEIPAEINLRFIGNLSERIDTSLNYLIYIAQSAELSITGEGSISVDFNYRGYNTIITSYGELTIDGNVLFDARQDHRLTRAWVVGVQNGNTTINGGRFYSFDNMGPLPNERTTSAVSVGKGSLTINGGEFRTFGDTTGNIPSLWMLSHSHYIRRNWSFKVGLNNEINLVKLRGGTFGDICTYDGTSIAKMLDEDHQLIKMETSGSSKSYRSLSDAELAETWVIESECMVIPKVSLTDPTLTVNGTPIPAVTDGAAMGSITPGTTTFTVSVDSPAWLTKLENQNYVNYTTKLLVMKGIIPLSSEDYTIGEIIKTEQADGTSKVNFNLTLKKPPAVGEVYRIAAVIQPVSSADDSNAIGNPAYGSWTLTTELSKTLTGTVHYTSSAVYGKPISTNVTGLPTGLTNDKLTRQWQRSTDGGSTWTDISGAAGSTYAPTAADLGENVRLRVQMTADGWSGELVSAPVKVSKAANNADPGIPVLTAEQDNSGNYTKFTITDFDADNKEYVYTTTAPSGSGWPTAGTTAITSPTVTGLNTGTTYYIYARYKATNEKEAGTVVRASSVLLGDEIRLYRLVLSDSAGNAYTDYGTGNTIYIQKDENVTLNFAKNPFSANTWSDFTVKSPDTTQSVFSVTSPMTDVASGSKIGSITIEGKSVGTATLGAYYNDIAGNYGTWQVVVYDPENVQSSQLRLASTPEYEDLTLSIDDTAALPTALPELLPANSGYTLEWRVEIPATGSTGTPTYAASDANIELNSGKIVPKAAHTSGSTTLRLVAVKDGKASPLNMGSCSFRVTVTDAPTITLTGLTVSPAKVYLNSNGTKQLTAVKTPVNAEGTLTWKSSDTTVATVDPDGNVTAIGKGEATITVGCGGKTAACTVTVDHEHNYGDTWTSGGDAGHYRICSCDGVDTAPHSFTKWTKADSDTHSSTCDAKGCGATRAESHTWVYDKQTKAPTLTAEGEAQYKCSADGCTATKTEIIPKLVTISEVNVTVAVPVRGNTPEKAYADSTEEYYVAATQWEPTVSSTFAGGTKYTVKVSLEASGSYRFTDSTTFKINGQTATIVETTPGADGTDNVILSYEFPATSSGSSSGGSGGSSSSAYTVTVNDSKNGSVTADRKTASYGTTVTLTVKPDQGWTLETLTATNASGKEIDLNIIKVGEKYTFKMPASNVTVKATFMEDNTILNYFVDVPTDSYYYDAVLWAVDKGITTGTDATHFSPVGICTRAQAVTFLWRAAGSPAPKTTTMPFTDVPAGSYYYNAVLWAVESGITKGTADTTFSPNLNCSRAQIVTFLWRSEQSPAAGTVNPFTDVKSDAYYADAVLWAVNEDVTKGTTNTTFSPDANCTRAQIVTFIWRCMK